MATVDRAIQELEKELIKISPEGKPISLSELAQATMSLNSIIRNRKLTSREITFAREQNTGNNLVLNDSNLSEEKSTLKKINHKHSEYSKFKGCAVPLPALAERGDRVYLKRDGDKHKQRELFVVQSTSNDHVNIIKLLHANTSKCQTRLGSKGLTVKQSDIYLAEKTRPQKPAPTKNNAPDNLKINQECLPVMPKRPTWKVFKTDSEDSSSIASEDDLMRECALQSESGSSFREQDICVQTSSSDFNPATSGSIDSPQNDTPTQGSARSSTSNNPHEEELEIDTNYDQHIPKKHDRISFLHDKNNTWMQVTLTSNGIKRYGGSYYNYVTADGNTGGVNLVPGSAWTHLPQALGGNDSIEQERMSNPLNDAFATLNISNQLNLRVPTSRRTASTDISNPLNMPFPRVLNYENILPLTSTPQEATFTQEKRRQSLVRHQGFLPTKLDDVNSSKQGGSSHRGAREAATQVKRLFSSSVSADERQGQGEGDWRK